MDSLGQVALSLQKAVNAAMDFCEKEFSEVKIPLCMYVCTICMYVHTYIFLRAILRSQIEEWNKVMKPRTSARIARGQKPRTVSITRSLKAGQVFPRLVRQLVSYMD